MPIDTPHSTIQFFTKLWKRCRDLIAGEDTVKAMKTIYLPKPEEMEEDTYNTFLDRATFYPASDRTANGYQGMIFRKEPEVKVPSSVSELLKDVTLSAIPFAMFAQQVTRQVIDVGRAGVLVDVQKEGTANRRPYLSMYEAESIVDWETENRGGDEVLVMVKLSETKTEKDPADEWARKDFPALRVLTLGPVIDNPEKEGARNFEKDVYRVRYYVKRESTGGDVNSSRESYNLEEDVVPTFANGDPLDFIPFQFFGANDLAPKIRKPPLLDLVNMNLSHYRTMADLEWALYFVAMPQVYVTGVAEAKLKRAPNTVWKFSDANSKVGVVGGDATDTSALSSTADKKEKMMATLGARLLEEQKKEAEAAETLRLRQSGEQASLSTISNSVGFGLEQVLKWLTLWASGNESEVSVKMNTIFVDESVDPQLVASIFEQLQAGKISYQTFYQNLIRFGIARDGVTAEEELALVDAETPAPAM